jgi:hypothetical protein
MGLGGVLGIPAQRDCRQEGKNKKTHMEHAVRKGRFHGSIQKGKHRLPKRHKNNLTQNFAPTLYDIFRKLLPPDLLSFS